MSNPTRGDVFVKFCLALVILLLGPDLVVGVAGLGPPPGGRRLEGEEDGEQGQGGLPHPHPGGDGRAPGAAGVRCLIYCSTSQLLHVSIAARD